MKRILAMLLAVVMMFGLLAGCGDKTPDPTTEPTVAPTQDTQPDPQLEKAIEYLRTFYKNAAEKTPMDYTRLGSVRIGITTYDIVWSVDVDEEVLKIVKNEDGTYTIDINEEANKETTEPTPYVLTATITGKDGRELSISWNHIIPAAIDEDAITAIKNAYALAAGETLEGTYTVTGVIKAIKTPYDPSYMNITVTIEVAGAEDMPIVCYRLKGDGADKLAVGDTITVTGSFMNYNGQVQFAAGCILEAVESGGGAAPVAPENPVDILKQAYALAPGESLPYNCSLSGVITFVDQAYSPDYGNITVTMKSNGYTIKCYRIKGDGVDQLNVNDEITVSGVITNYNGTIEFAAGSMLISRVDHEPPAKQPDPTPGSTLTVGQAYNVGMGKDHDTYTEGSYYITGTIVSIENDYYGNMHISDGTGKLMIYGSYSEDGNTRFGDLPSKPAVGDTVTLYGKIGRYGSNPQMKNAWIIGAKGDAPVIPDAPSVDKVTELVAGTPYRFGMAQGNLENVVYYLAGGMDGFYMKTTADPAAAINVYVEVTEGGYYFYTLSGETKLYINMVVSADGAHVNGAYEATASTVYTYDTTLIATVDGVPYWFGTRNDKTYTTMGPCKVELAGFFGEFYVGSEETPDEPEQPEEPEQPAESLKEGVAYTISAVNGKGTLWFNGSITSGRFNGSYNESEAVLVYAENVEGGFLLYFMDGETKQYICIADTSSGGSFSTDAASATVFEWNADKATAAVAEDSNNRGFGVGATSTYDNFSAYDLSGAYNWGQFIPVDGGNTDPDVPACEHKNTKVEGAVEATCTTDGHTGKTVCTDCGETVNAGDVIPATGHNFVNGTCTKCGEAESEEPETPAEPTYVTSITAGTAYKLGLFSTSKNATYYFMGTMSGYYGATETVYADGVDVFVEDTTDGYYLYFLDANGAKQYINLVASGTYRNFTYATTASSVYTWNAEKNALYTTVEGEICYIGTYGSYVTMGVLQTAKLKDTDYIARLYTIEGSSEPDVPTCEHKNTKVEGAVEATCTTDGHTGKTVCTDCGKTVNAGDVIPATGHNFVNGTCTKCGEADPNYTPDEPEQPTTGLKEGVGYTISAVNGTGTLWFNGTVTSGRFNGSYNESEAVLVYAENVEGGFLLYFMDGETKQYICIEDKSAGGSFSTDAASATVFEWNAEKATAAVAEDSNNRAFGVGATSTYANFSAYDLTGNYNWGQYIPAEGGNTEPDVPTCEHLNTKVEGAADATCTTDGHTGKTVCTDCGETVNAGSVITSTGHNFVNGTCTKCGETESEPEEPATGLKEGVGYTISAVNGTGTLWFNGTVTSGRFNGSYDESEAVLVYAENVEGGFLLYFLDGEVKQYICMDDKAAGGSFGTDAATATVFEWNADKATAAVAEDSNNRAFGVGATSTYANFSAYDLTGNYNWGQYIPAEGGNTEPEDPFCQHNTTDLEGQKNATCTAEGYTGDYVCTSCGDVISTGSAIPATGHINTKVVDAVAATCSTDGYTGNTVCTDCGVTISQGTAITATGHDFADGTCTKCGEADPDYVPEQPGVTTVNKADFNTIVTSNANGDSSYTKTFTTANGWVTANSAIQSGGPAGCSNPQYTVIGPDNTYKAVCMNGKTSAPGSITSPTLTGGISKLTMKYTKMFTDTKLSATITITDLTSGAVYTNTAAIEWDKNTKYVVETFEWVLETPITGDFTIVIANDCPTAQNSNKDRMTVLELAWEAAAGNTDEELTHPFETGDGAAAYITEDGYLNCFQLSSEVIYYNTFFTEMPEESWVGIRELNGTFYYTSSPSWGVIPFDGYTISGNTLQLNPLTFDEEEDVAQPIVLELISNTQYKVISGNASIPEGLVFDFGSDSCAVIGHSGDRHCEEDVICFTCKKVICAGLGHEYGEDGVCFRCWNATRPEEPEQSGLVVGKAYKFAMTQGNLDNRVFYLAGGMSGYYMATTEDASAAIDVYVEETAGGYYFYTMNGNDKLYINMVVSGTHVNGSYDATASTVYTYDAANNTLIAVVNGTEYWFATRNDNTYTTLGPCKVSYAGFFALFC